MKRILPKNARMFEDYGAYVASNSSLWVWSLDGLSQQEEYMDPNRGNLIYERQVLAELLEYGYMRHRSLYHRVEKFMTTAQVIAVRREIVKMRRYMREASHAGEVRDLLRSGWKELGLPSLVSEINALLRLRESETRSAEASRTTRVGWALTIVFGFVAVPALADQVIQPIWKLTRFHEFTNPSLAAAVSDSIAILLVGMVLWATLFWVAPRDE
jgi:hypothetical protein